jgi:exodeoxyribonuclease VII large subunit
LFGTSSPPPSPRTRPRPERDEVPGISPASAVSIAALNEILRTIIEGAIMPLWVRGEVCDFKAHRNGHWYFSLRDGGAQIRCVIWKRDRFNFPAAPEDGMQVAALAQPTLYPARGELHLTIRKMEAEGDGLWRKAFTEAKARLERDGLLDPARKRPIHPSPKRIAVITSDSGAALHDIVAVVRRRSPAVEIVVVNARVQGALAPTDLVDAIERVGRWKRANTVIIGRGGGGGEDLWAFNDERVARAVAACPLPVISAVGHEVDVTLCDMVADLRAPTPSAAAERAVPDVQQVARALRVAGAGMRRALERRVSREKQRNRALAGELKAAMTRSLVTRRAALRESGARLNALSPLATLSRGYAVARDASGRALSRVSSFSANEPFELLLADGSVNAVTTAVTVKKPEEAE